MELSHFLSCYYPDPSYGGKRLFTDMVEQAETAERIGYRSVTIPEHHLIDILLTPSPLQMAVKVASVTERLDLVTSVAVLGIAAMTRRGFDVQTTLLAGGGALFRRQVAAHKEAVEGSSLWIPCAARRSDLRPAEASE